MFILIDSKPIYNRSLIHDRVIFSLSRFDRPWSPDVSRWVRISEQFIQIFMFVLDDAKNGVEQVLQCFIYGSDDLKKATDF